MRYSDEQRVVYVRAYLVYKDAYGTEQIVYGDCVKADKDGVIAD